MKKLIMIAGPAGVGKTAVCAEMFAIQQGSAWLDGDWCWMVNPYPGKTDRQKQYVERAFGYILDGYLADANTGHVFFSWLMRSDSMFDLVTTQISNRDYRLYKYALVCEDRAVYKRRMRDGGRRREQVEADVDMASFRRLSANIIDVSDKTPRETALEILAEVNADG